MNLISGAFSNLNRTRKHTSGSVGFTFQFRDVATSFLGHNDVVQPLRATRDCRLKGQGTVQLTVISWPA